MKNLAIGYARVSTWEQAAEGFSLGAQRGVIEAYCRIKGLALTEIVEDPGVSASRPLAQRPGGSRLMALVESGKIGHVVFARLDRGFRNASDCLSTIETWRKRGITVHFCDLGGSSLDTESPHGRFLLCVLAAVSEMERNLIAERTKNVLSFKRQNGQIYGPVPYGFAREGECLRPEPKEMEVLAFVKRMRAEGYSLRAIAATLNANGIPTKRGGKRWAPETVRKLLSRA